MSKLSKSEERVKQVIDRSVEELDEIYDMLMDEAKGVHFAVAPHLPGRMKPKPAQAEKVALGDEVERVCKACKQPILKEPPVVWEVWKEKRDGALLKFLLEWAAGKSRTRESEKTDTEIYVVFGDIDSLPSGETTTKNEVNELKGSHPRTPGKTGKSKLDALVEGTKKEKPTLGII